MARRGRCDCAAVNARPWEHSRECAAYVPAKVRITERKETTSISTTGGLDVRQVLKGGFARCPKGCGKLISAVFPTPHNCVREEF